MTSAKNDSTEPGKVVTQYETLRTAALGGALPPDARAGMMLFLRRGMWGWSCALATRMTTELPTGSRPANWNPPEECRTIVHIFAAMAIRISFQGATA
jgi:hypothetical protein